MHSWNIEFVQPDLETLENVLKCELLKMSDTSEGVILKGVAKTTWLDASIHTCEFVFIFAIKQWTLNFSNIALNFSKEVNYPNK